MTLIILEPQSMDLHRFRVVKVCDIPFNEPMVAQRYIAKPYLIDGLNFDLRIIIKTPL